MRDSNEKHEIASMIASARARIKRAATYDAEERTELTCEDAHQAAEHALKALIATHGGEYKSIHNIEHLLETLEELGETIPEEVMPATELTDYSGGRRHDFITGVTGSPALESVSDALKAARDTL